MIPVADPFELTFEELQYIADRRNIPCPLDGITWERLTEEELRQIADRRNVDYLRRLGLTDEEIFQLTEEELRQVADRRNLDYLRRLGLTDEEIARHDRTSAEWMMGPCPIYDRENDQTSKPEKVDPTPTAIYLPHSLDPEEKKRIGYPLSEEDEEEILRRLLKRTEQRLRDNPMIVVFPASPEQRAATLRELERGGLNMLVERKFGSVPKKAGAPSHTQSKPSEKKPDLGLHIRNLGYKAGLAHDFYGISFVDIDFVAPSLHSVTLDFPAGDMIYTVSFDFDQHIAEAIFAKLTSEERSKFRASIADRTLPFRATLPRPIVLQVVESYLGEVQDKPDGCSFVPFVIKRVNDPTETPVEMQLRQLVLPGIIRGRLAS